MYPQVEKFTDHESNSSELFLCRMAARSTIGSAIILHLACIRQFVGLEKK